MKSPDYNQILESLKVTIVRAGSLLYSYLGKNNKELFEIDNIIEKFIVNEIESLIPKSGIWAEESGYKNTFKSDYIWLVDPIDGTTNFKRNLPFFCISIALVYKTRPVLGIIYDPCNKNIFYALENEGAYCNDKQLVVSSTSKLKQAVIEMGFTYNKDLLRKYIKLRYEIRTVRYLGSVALAFTYVASGILDAIILAPVRWWDVAAGILLVQEAQGVVTCVDITQNNVVDHIIASNKLLYPKLNDSLINF